MRIIQVGYGYWGESWMQFIAGDPDTELAALVVRREEALKEAQKRWNLADRQCFTDYDQALRTEADAVLIALPHPSHIPFARKAVLAHKNVLIEKPLCDDLDEAKEFAAWMKGRREKVWVSQNYRYRSELWRLRKGFADGSLGGLQFIQLDYRAGMTANPDEHLWNIQGWRGKQVNMLCYEICVHHFDMLRFLCRSNVKQVYCSGWTPSWGLTAGPESVFVTLEFENGIRAFLSAHSCSVGAPTEFQGNWQLQGSRGLATWTSGKGLNLSPADDCPGKIPSDDQIDFPGFDRSGVLRELKKALDGSPSTLPTLSDNLYSLAVSAAVLLSARENRVVTLDELLLPKEELL